MLSEIKHPTVSLTVKLYCPSPKLKIVSFEFPLLHRNDKSPIPPPTVAVKKPSFAPLQDIVEPL